MKVLLVIGPDCARLVRAKSEKAAIQHVVSTSYTARNIKSDELVDLLMEGYLVEDIDDTEEDRSPRDVQVADSIEEMREEEVAP